MYSTVDTDMIVRLYSLISRHPGRGFTPFPANGTPLLDSRVSCFVPASPDPGTIAGGMIITQRRLQFQISASKHRRRNLERWQSGYAAHR